MNILDILRMQPQNPYGATSPEPTMPNKLGKAIQNRWTEINTPQPVKPMTQQEAMDIALMGGVLKNPALQESAKKYFGTTFYPQETGYIMDDLSRLDFTGRNQASGYRNVAGRYIPEAGKPDYLKMERSVDHREVSPLLPQGTESGWGSLSKFLDDTGAIRYDANYGISLVNTNKPNAQQIEKVVNDFRKSKTPLLIDIDKTTTGQNLASKEFENPTVDQVKRWINKTYKGLVD